MAWKHLIICKSVYRVLYRQTLKFYFRIYTFFKYWTWIYIVALMNRTCQWMPVEQRWPEPNALKEGMLFLWSCLRYIQDTILFWKLLYNQGCVVLILFSAAERCFPFTLGFVMGKAAGQRGDGGEGRSCLPQQGTAKRLEERGGNTILYP